MNMPGILNIYFNADNGNDADALSKAFAFNAIVEDEGARHQRVAEIREWWVTAKPAARDDKIVRLEIR